MTLDVRPETAGEIDIREIVLEISCDGVLLPGIVAERANPSAGTDVAMLVLVGGPQYRVGSHRQFVQLARAVARVGLTVLRFDYRGMGDADGAIRSFEDAGLDVHAAIDALLCYAPHVRGVILWGLCDAASLALMHGLAHPAVRGVALANPWVRSDATLAAVTVKHYYGSRLLQRDLWYKLLSGRFDFRESLRSLWSNVAQASTSRRGQRSSNARLDFQTRMAHGLAAFSGPVLLILSGDDLTAREFIEYTTRAPAWASLLDATRVSHVAIPNADHTFSQRSWRSEAEQQTCAWIRANFISK